MGLGLFVSVLLHVGVLAWALLSFHTAAPLKLPDEPPVEVSIISQIDLETRQKKGDSLSKIEEAAQSAGKAPSPKDAPKPMPVRAVAPPPPAASEPAPPEPPTPPEPVKEEPPPAPKPDQIAALIEKTPTPTPPPEPDGPTLDDKKKLEEKIAEQQRQDEAKKAAEKAAADAKKKADDLAKKKADKKLADDKKKKDDAKKAAEAKNKFDPSKIAQDIASAPDLLNKVKDQPSAAQGADTPPSKPTTAKGPTAGSRTGNSNVNTARAKDMLEGQLRAAFRQCWNKPIAGGGVPAPVVTLKWSLNQDGTLRSDIKLVQPRGDDPLAQPAIRAAQSAVQKCVPFQLPPELYDMWRDIEWFFDPQQE